MPLAATAARNPVLDFAATADLARGEQITTDLGVTPPVIPLVLLLDWPSQGAYIEGLGGMSQRGGVNDRR